MLNIFNKTLFFKGIKKMKNLKLEAVLPPPHFCILIAK